MSKAFIKRSIDFTKPLIKVELADNFYNRENIEQPENNNTINDANGENKAQIQHKKSNIIIPTAKEIVNGIKGQNNSIPNYLDEKMLKKRKNQIQYIRTSYKVFLPSNCKYEATDKDILFINEINDKLHKTGVNVRLSVEKFEKIIEIWEEKVNKEDMLPFYSLQYCTMNEFKENDQIIKEYLQDIYTYWKGLRELYQRPLLRKYWKVINKDESNPNIAFRIRENPKMKTRRSQRANDPENLEKMKSLKNNLDMAHTLLSNITYRELIKLELLDLNILKFEQSIQDKPDLATFTQILIKLKQRYDSEPILSLKNRLKELNKAAQRFINDYNGEHKPVVEPTKEAKTSNEDLIFRTSHISPTQTVDDSNYDIAAFIASLTEECLAKDITLPKVQNLDLPSINSPPDSASTIVVNIQTQIDKPDDTLDRQNSLKKNSNIIELPKPTVIEPPPANITRQKSSLLIASNTVEEKNIFRYKIRKRMGRQGRIIIEKIFEEDEVMAKYTDHERALRQYGLDLSTVPTEILDKLPRIFKA